MSARVDHKQRMLRAVRVFGWAGVALSVGAAIVRVWATDEGSLLLIGLWALANVVNMGVVSAVPTVVRKYPAARANLRAIQIALYFTNLIVQGGLLAVCGGADTAIFLLFLPTVLFAALDTSRFEALFWGAAAAGTTVLTAYLTDTLDSDHAATLFGRCRAVPGHGLVPGGPVDRLLRDARRGAGPARQPGGPGGRALRCPGPHG